MHVHFAQWEIFDVKHLYNIIKGAIIMLYYMPITDTTLELSVFWPLDTESRINKLKFSESTSLSFKTKLMSFICFCGDVTYSKLQAWNQRRKTC